MVRQRQLIVPVLDSHNVPARNAFETYCTNKVQGLRRAPNWCIDRIFRIIGVIAPLLCAQTVAAPTSATASPASVLRSQKGRVSLPWDLLVHAPPSLPLGLPICANTKGKLTGARAFEDATTKAEKRWSYCYSGSSPKRHEHRNRASSITQRCSGCWWGAPPQGVHVEDIAASFHDLVTHFMAWSVSCIPRANNFLAHNTAKWAKSADSGAPGWYPPLTP